MLKLLAEKLEKSDKTVLKKTWKMSISEILKNSKTVQKIQPFEKSSDLVGRELSSIYLEKKNFPGNVVFTES